MNKEFVPSEQWGWTASSHLQCSHTKGVATPPDHLLHSPSIPTSGPACTPLLAGQSPDRTQAVVSCNVSARLDAWMPVFHIISRLLKACGSRLTEKLLEGAPTEDTLVLIERQTGSHVVFHQTEFCNGNLCVSHSGRCSNIKLYKRWRWKTVSLFWKYFNISCLLGRVGLWRVISAGIMWSPCVPWFCHPNCLKSVSHWLVILWMTALHTGIHCLSRKSLQISSGDLERD